jgi:hypothetical protein
MSVRGPRYRCHKASGQALVGVNGRRIYLGESAALSKISAELRAPVPQQPTAATSDAQRAATKPATMAEFALDYFRVTNTCCRKYTASRAWSRFFFSSGPSATDCGLAQPHHNTNYSQCRRYGSMTAVLRAGR